MGRGLNISDTVEASVKRFPGAAVLDRKFGPFEILARLDPRKMDGLVEEANEKNHLTVAVYRATRGESGVRHRMESSEQFGVVGTGPSVVMADIARMLRGRKPVFFDKAIRLCGGELVGAFPNIRTNVGVDFCAAQLSGTSVAVADTIALAASTRSPTATDAATTLPWNTAQTTDAAPVADPSATAGEITFGGLQRHTATYAHTVGGPSAGNASYTLTFTWTFSTTITSTQLAGLFGGSAKASQGGTNVNNMLFLESSYTPTTGNNGDQIALTWTVNI